jgi:RNA polymerase sigma factor (sigma-70 family)
MPVGGELAVWQRFKRVVHVADEEEQRLVRAAADGDTSAFDALARGHWRKVASVAGRFLADPNDIEDAVQETFVRAFENLRGFRGQASVQTWLIRIAVNVCKNKRSEFWRRRVNLTDDDSLLKVDPADARVLAETGMVLGDREHMLQRALSELPERLRLPIVLHFFEELSGREIAAVLGWNESTVWSRIYTGCRELRKKLGPELEDEVT